jgi:hypothetical protein
VPPTQSSQILESLRVAAAALRDAKIDFALGGGLAAWARGGPPTEHDVDFLIRGADIDAALCALRDAGLTVTNPPEAWLVKAWLGDVLIDLIHDPLGIDVGTELFERCDELSVAAIDMLVLPLEDLFVGKLLALTEHNLDFGPPLEWARALREQINWAEIGHRTQHAPFARAFFHLLVELNILDGYSEMVVR